MEENTKGSTCKIKRMETEYLFGRMDSCIMANGAWGCRMEKVVRLLRRAVRGMASGKKVFLNSGFE